jgi:glycosyltransferase involved in cell wall biosynthesis
LLHAREPELGRLLEVRFIGRIVETEASSFQGMAGMGVECLGYLPHKEALSELARSHAVLCLLDDLPGADRIYPAKIFEIMYLGRPCLALAPGGALAELVRRHALGEVIHPRDSEGIYAALSGMLRRFRDRKAGAFNGAATHAVDIERFDRERQAGEFARVFRAALDHAYSKRAHSPRGEGVAFAK